MSDSHHDSDGYESQRLAGLLGRAADQAFDEAFTPDRARSEWQRLVDATACNPARGSRKRPNARRWLMVPALACAGLAAFFTIFHFRDGKALRFTVDGQVSPQSELVSRALQTRFVEFSDGSNLVLRPLGRLRIGKASSRGAILSLDHGRIDLSIRHRPAAQWSVEAGPYRVAVSGTRFNVGWDPGQGDVRVELVEGEVEVSGPGIAPPIALRAGQTVEATVGGGYAIKDRPAETGEPLQPSSPAPSPLPSPAQEAPIARGPSSAGGPRRPASAALSTALAPEKPKCEWTTLVSSGQFGTIVAQARRIGLSAALAECPTDSLFALADAARYLGDLDLSERTLKDLSSRSRDDAGKAAFFLGRLEEARGNLQRALDWYAKATQDGRDSRYIREAQDGSARIKKAIASPSSHADPR